MHRITNGRSSSSSCATPKTCIAVIVFNPILVHSYITCLRKVRPCSANDCVYEDGEITMATGGGECETLLIGQIVTVHSADGWFLIDKFSNRRVRDFETFVISKKKKEKKITAISFRNASVSPPV